MTPFLGNIFRSRSTTPISDTSYASSKSASPATSAEKDPRSPPSSLKPCKSIHATLPTPSTPTSAGPPVVKAKEYAVTACTPKAPGKPLPPTPLQQISRDHERSLRGDFSTVTEFTGVTNVRFYNCTLWSLTLQVPTTTGPSASRDGGSVAFRSRMMSLPSPTTSTVYIVRQRSSTDPSRTLRYGASASVPRLGHQGPQATTSAPPLPDPDFTTSVIGDASGQVNHALRSKPRPLKLTLQTSNLTPPRSSSHLHPKPICAQVIPSVSSASLSVAPAYRMRDTYVDPVELLAPARNDRGQGHVLTCPAEPVKLPRSFRPERPHLIPHNTTSDLHAPTLTAATAPLGTSHGVEEQLYGPLSSSTSTTLSPLARSSPSQAFERIPLPWTPISAQSLSEELGSRFDILLAYTLRNTGSTPPALLRPSTFKTSLKEDQRLRTELERLRGKYGSVTRYRDGLISSLTHPDISGNAITLRQAVESLKKITARCDRVARQIFICNDQIRQIEIQNASHTVGVLRITLERMQREADDRAKRADLHLTMATTMEQTADTNKSSVLAQETDHDTEDELREEEDVDIRHVSIFVPSRDVNTEEPTGDGQNKDKHYSHRMSRATIVSLNQLGFPLPPTRDEPDIRHPSPAPQVDSTQTPSTESFQPSSLNTINSPLHQQRITGAHITEPHKFRSHMIRSASAPFLETYLDGDEILIYPPTRRRSSSAPPRNVFPTQDFPLTPWSAKYPDNQPPLRSATAPLRIRSAPRNSGSKARISKAKKRLSETTSSATKGRESQWSAVSVCSWI